MSQSRIGRELAGRFRITSPIGEGDGGVVYAAEDKSTGRRAAVRFLRRELAEDRQFLAAFREEADKVAGLAHENLAAVLGSGEDEEGIPWLAVEHVGGRTLRKLLDEDGRLPYDRAARIVAQVLRALAAAEAAGVVHRNLRPENVKLEPVEGAVERARVLDFGVARPAAAPPNEVAAGDEGKTGLVSEVSNYQSPEQILGEAMDTRSNLYSTGVILYEMLTGSTPFPPGPPSKYVSEYLAKPIESPQQRVPGLSLPPGIEKLLLDLLGRAPTDRPAGAAAAADLADAFAMRETSAPAAVPRVPRGHFLAYLLGGIVGGGAAALISREFAAPAAAAGIGLGVGATVAFKAFPRVGELHSWFRLAIGATVIGVAGFVAHVVQGGEAWLHLSYPLAALLALCLYSVGWGRRKRALAVFLGAVIAPIAAFALLPVPTGTEFVFVTKLVSEKSFGLLRPAIAAACIGMAFGLSGLFAPPAGVKRVHKG